MFFVNFINFIIIAAFITTAVGLFLTIFSTPISFIINLLFSGKMNKEIKEAERKRAEQRRLLEEGAAREEEKLRESINQRMRELIDTRAKAKAKMLYEMQFEEQNEIEDEKINNLFQDTCTVLTDSNENSETENTEYFTYEEYKNEREPLTDSDENSETENTEYFTYEELYEYEREHTDVYQAYNLNNLSDEEIFDLFGIKKSSPTLYRPVEEKNPYLEEFKRAEEKKRKEDGQKLSFSSEENYSDPKKNIVKKYECKEKNVSVQALI